MSKHLQQNKAFLSLILNSSKQQATALIDTISPEQLYLLEEIAHNLLKLPLNKETSVLVNKNKGFLKKLAGKATSQSNKIVILRKNFKQLLATLWSVRTQLEELL